MSKGVVSFATEQGPRSYQEDRGVVVVFPPVGPKWCLIAVMDGHGGKETVECASRTIRNAFISLTGLEGSPPAGRVLSEEEVLRALVAVLAEQTAHFEDGSTLSIAWVLEDRDEAVIAVLGDSPIVVVDRSGNVHLGPDHNVRTNLKEREAGVARGASYRRGYLENWRGDGLQMSRSLGDCTFDSFLSREPEICTIKEPKWVVVASDGLLDPTHRDEIQDPLKELVELLSESVTADKVMAWAVKRGLRDNTTVILWEAKD